MFAWFRLAALILAIVSGPVGAVAETRVALVVGNGAYAAAQFTKRHQRSRTEA